MKPLSESRVLVTGATGFTGRVLIRKLIDEGSTARAIARHSSNIDCLSDLQIEWCRGDVFDPDVVKEATEGVDYIFHVAAAYRDAGITDKQYWNVHVKSTQLLAQAAAKMPDFQRMIHTSTVGVHGHIPDPPADETAPFAPGDIYQKTKAEAETWLHEFAGKNNLPYTVMRPAAIMGPDDKRLLKVFRMAAWPIFPILGSGQCLYHIIHVEDLADIMMHAATHPAAQGQAFICGNDGATSLMEMGKTVADTLRIPFRPLRLPAGPFFAAAAVCEAVCKPLKLSPPIYRRRVAFYTKDRAFDTTKLRTVLKYQPKRTNIEAIRETTLGYVKKGWIKASSM